MYVVFPSRHVQPPPLPALLRVSSAVRVRVRVRPWAPAPRILPLLLDLAPARPSKRRSGGKMPRAGSLPCPG